MAPFSNIVHAYLQSKDEGKTTEENRAGEGNGSRVVIGASLLRVSLRVGRSLGARLGNGLVAVLGVGAGLLRGGGAGGGGLFVGAGGGGGSSIRGSSAVGLVGVLVVATSGLRSADARGEEVLVDAAVAALNVSSSLLLGAVALLALGDAVNGVQSLVLVGVGNRVAASQAADVVGVAGVQASDDGRLDGVERDGRRTRGLLRLRSSGSLSTGGNGESAGNDEGGETHGDWFGDYKIIFVAKGINNSS